MTCLTSLVLLLPLNSCKGGGDGGEAGTAESLTNYLPGDTLVPRGFLRAELHISGIADSAGGSGRAGSRGSASRVRTLNLVCLPEDRGYDSTSGALGTEGEWGTTSYSWWQDAQGNRTELSGRWWQQGNSQSVNCVMGLWVERSGEDSAELINDLTFSIQGREDEPELTDETIILNGEVISGTLIVDANERPISLSGASVRLTYTIAPEYQTPDFHRDPRAAAEENENK